MFLANKRILALAGLLVLCVLSLLYMVWSNRVLHRHLGDTEGMNASLTKELTTLVKEYEALDRENVATKQENADLRTECQSLADRAANLSAQRDHLRAEIEKKNRQSDELSSHVASLESELAEARHRVLQLEQLPGELTAKLSSVREQLAMHEAEIDRLTGQLAEMPEPLTFSGTSEDKKVFALQGVDKTLAALPQSVLLCNTGGIVLEGWIYKSTDGYLIGHARKWHQPASALVKGEKVIMLPSKSHEMHH